MTALWLIGLLQMGMGSVFLLHRGFQPRDIWQAVQPLMALWVFMWPAYESVVWLWLGMLLLLVMLFAALLLNSMFWSDLCAAWSPRLGADTTSHQRLHAPFALWLALMIAVILIEQGMPEFALGIGLSACLSFPLARLVDRLGIFPLPLPLHPEHTIPGYALLLLSMTVFCSWSIHMYHGVDWLLILPAAIMAACLACVIRMLLPQWWNLPLAMLASSFLLWYL